MKYLSETAAVKAYRSPSLGREWIEMVAAGAGSFFDLVSLLGEGVD